jgi:hypothetical protein
MEAAIMAANARKSNNQPGTLVWSGPQSQNPFGENQTNYNPEQQQQRMDEGRRQQAQFEQQRMLQQRRMHMQMPARGGKDGAHSHRERTSGLGGMIKSAATHARRKGGQSPSPYNSPYNTEEF